MDIMKMIKQANNLKKMQKDIAKCSVSDNIDGANMTLGGTGEVKSIEIEQQLYDKGKNAVEDAVKKVVNSCIKKQMDLYKQKAKDAMGGVDLTGMLG